MGYLDNHYVESPFLGTLVIDREKVFIRYAHGDVWVAETQAKLIREAVGEMLIYVEGVNFVILPTYLNPRDHVAIVTVPDNMFQKYEQEEAH